MLLSNSHGHGAIRKTLSLHKEEYDRGDAEVKLYNLQ